MLSVDTSLGSHGHRLFIDPDDLVQFFRSMTIPP
jgi:hypothetical protein